jgi:hypothetical protein
LNQSPAPPAADNVPDAEIIEVTEITTAPPSLPGPPPPLPLVDFVILFIVNGKEICERGIVIDVNQDYELFERQLNDLVEKQLPHAEMTVLSHGVKVVYKRTYVTKAQGVKRKDLAWMDFEDALDYTGLVNVIRNSNSPKMTLLIRAFITIPKEDFDEQILPIIALQRMVSYFTITTDSRL